MADELILEKLNNLTRGVDEIKKAIFNLIDPKDGVITNMKSFQASCPRRQFKWIWLVIIPIGLGNLAVAYAAIAAMLKLN